MSNFLQLEGISGSSKNPEHLGEFEFNSIEFGYNKKDIFGDKVSHSGKVIGDLSLKRKCDEDSNKLATALVGNKQFPSGKITVEYPEDKYGEQKIYTLNMKNVSIAAIHSDNSNEEISLAYEIRK